MRAALTEEAAAKPTISSRDEVLRLLRFELGGLRRERILALYLNTKLQLLRVKRIADGSCRFAPLDVPLIIHAALDTGAAGFVIVHNHPSGDPAPSDTDRLACARLRRIAGDLDMHLIDALVVAGGEVRSVFD